jgi:2-C-methyl-D-erythritol 4-phosphate cytidylyltransferase
MYFILLASGESARFESLIPKQIFYLGNKLVIQHVIDSILPLNPIKIIIITNLKCIETIKNLINDTYSNVINMFEVVVNEKINSHRLDSLEIGLKSLEYISELRPDSKIIIHDVARPYLSTCDYQKLIDEMGYNMVYVQYCLKINGGLINSKTFEFVDRDDYLETTTPLIITYNVFKEIYDQYLSRDHNGIRHNYEFIPFLKEKNYKFTLIHGNYKILRKITTKDDL